MKKLLILFLFSTALVSAQNNCGYWQQYVNYKMTVDFNAENHTYTGNQELTYKNNSPDTLHRVFYHLFLNAFQPGSEMDVRSRTIADPDKRVGDRISKLTPEEIGYIKVLSLNQDGVHVVYKEKGTVLEVTLNKPLLPGQQTVFTMKWDAQVPIQIRRTGRDNKEGVAYSMTQWYPKLAEYDFEGWHPDPYIAREFHGVWGDFDVTIKIDKDYIVGGTGYVQNTNKKGIPKKVKKGKRIWHFTAPNVHDFTWAADKDYIHDSYEGPDGITLNFYYKNNPEILDNWKKLQPKTAELMAFYNQHIGKYPYNQYSVIQGGDGGMEYAMCTLITGNRKFESLVGVTAHEMAHSWFQFLLATNESQHEWMDEGFTSYISDIAMNVIMDEKKDNPFASAYANYRYLANSGKEQPLSTHADRYATNMNYGISAYSKGEVFLAQLNYLIGKENVDKTLKRYFNDWVFKHPTPNDFIRAAEKSSGALLHWYLTDFTQTTNTIDYSIEEVTNENGTNKITLKRNGLMPMPIDLFVLYEDGSKESYYIPLQMMHFTKENPFKQLKRTVLKDWAWAYPTYSFTINNNKKIKSILIDATQLMADITPENNIYIAE
jgi:hypothetical protein